MSRLSYYISSIPTLFAGFDDFVGSVVELFFRKTSIVRLKSGLRFYINSLMDLWIVKETCLDRQYETFGTPIQDDWTVIDIGAGLGDFAVMVGYQHPSARVYAFEPFPKSFELLEDNIQLNQVRNVRAQQVAIGGINGELLLSTTGESVQHTTTDSTKQGEPTQKIKVKSISLDELLSESSEIKHCDFMKMDCEGAEYEILFNASQSTFAKIQRICMEYHDGFTQYNHSDLEQFLKGQGYFVKTQPNPVHGYIGFLYAWRE